MFASHCGSCFYRGDSESVYSKVKMDNTYFNRCLYKLQNGIALERDEWRSLLTSSDEKSRRVLLQCAAEITNAHFGKAVFVRGLIEISAYCRNNCKYCGLRCENREAERYRLSKTQILDCCRQGAALGFNTFVLQGGEDPVQNDTWITDLVRDIKREYPDKAVTLSVGERSYEAYKAFRDAGADRYLLRHETRNDEHYARLHPSNMVAAARRKCLSMLKELGFQTGSGMMIGTPWQTIDNIIDDLQYLEELNPEMIGIGPFIPAAGTPFADFPPGSADFTILIVSLLRMRFHKALIPATTAVATIDSRGMEKAILAGANVLMPNLSPADVRGKYSIYDNKKVDDTESAQRLDMLQQKLNAIDRYIDFGRGDYVK